METSGSDNKNQQKNDANKDINHPENKDRNPNPLDPGQKELSRHDNAEDGNRRDQHGVRANDSVDAENQGHYKDGHQITNSPGAVTNANHQTDTELKNGQSTDYGKAHSSQAKSDLDQNKPQAGSQNSDKARI